MRSRHHSAGNTLRQLKLSPLKRNDLVALPIDHREQTLWGMRVRQPATRLFQDSLCFIKREWDRFLMHTIIQHTIPGTTITIRPGLVSDICFISYSANRKSQIRLVFSPVHCYSKYTPLLISVILNLYMREKDSKNKHFSSMRTLKRL